LSKLYVGPTSDLTPSIYSDRVGLGLDKVTDEVVGQLGQNEIRANHGLLGFTVMTVV